MKVINAEAEYQVALKRLDEIFFAEENSTEEAEADLLVLSIEAYEEMHFPILPHVPNESCERHTEGV